MSFSRHFKVIYRPKIDRSVLPVDKTQLEFKLFADNVDAARRIFKESNPEAWIVTIVPADSVPIL